jgi:hypothetical protein
MSVKSHADWLPSGKAGASDGQALQSGEPQVLSGTARVDSSGMEVPAGDIGALPAPNGRVLSEDELAAGGFFTERVLEVAEIREEAVVEKQVVVREEVVLRKERAERVEEINETVRRTEVEVDETSSSGTGRTG